MGNISLSKTEEMFWTAKNFFEIVVLVHSLADLLQSQKHCLFRICFSSSFIYLGSAGHTSWSIEQPVLSRHHYSTSKWWNFPQLLNPARRFAAYRGWDQLPPPSGNGKEEWKCHLLHQKESFPKWIPPFEVKLENKWERKGKEGVGDRDNEKTNLQMQVTG